ncbi:MAG: hypothetical protein JWR16_1992 [Nevskia sp.]|nr:hypothetical protein [Nevskia sp.]
MPTDLRPWSLRGRLIRLFAAGGFAAWLVSGALVLAVAEREDDDDWDIALERSALIVLRWAADEYSETGGGLEDLRGSSPMRFAGQMIQIRDPDGRLLLRTEDAPETPLAPSGQRFCDIHLASGDWRVGTFRDDATGLVIQMADSESRRQREFLQLGAALLVPIIIGLPLLMVGAWLLAARALQPLYRAARHLGERPGADLSPIGAGELPQEAMPLVDAFNLLLHQLAESWEDERRFAASIAHELRTPLAGIRLNLQRLQHGSSDPVLQSRLLVLIGAVDRATRVIEQLLTLARLERNVSRELTSEPLDLRRIIDETLGEFSSRASEQGIRFEVRADAAPVRVPAQAFYLVLRNFVENAVRHSPRDGSIRISASRDASQWWLQVEDAGPGIVPAPLTRTADKSDDAPLLTENLQIGLSLVRKIAELFGGQVDSGRSAALGGASFRFSAPLRGDDGSGAPPAAIAA